MATKKECDRCGKQWELTDNYETCSISVVLPAWKSAPYGLDWDSKTSIEKVYELCQGCARAAVNLLIPKGEPVDKSS